LATVLITGDPAGFGGAIMPRLAAAGHDVIFGHGAGAAAAVAELVEKAATAGGGRVRGRELTLTDGPAMRELVREAESAVGPLDAVVACGIDGSGPDGDDTLAGLDATYQACRAVIFSFIRRKAGCVVAVTSAAGQDGDPDQPLRSAAAAGIAGLVLSVAKEYAGMGIRANVVVAGQAPTAVADLVAMLISEQGSALNGQVLRTGPGWAG
jgi:3-oxoacyl-[acyl-carrier protein] reductase